MDTTFAQTVMRFARTRRQSVQHSLTALMLSGLCLLGFCGHNAIAQEEIHLDSGQVVIGDLVSETPDSVVIRSYFVMKHKPVANVQTFTKDQIVQRHQVPSFQVQFRTRLKDTPDTMLGHLSLARWALDHALIKEAGSEARRADDLDTDNVLVAQVLSDCGYTKDHDEWVNEDEYLKKTGKVIYENKIMLKADADHLRAIAVATNDHDDSIQEIKDDYGYLTHGDDKIKEATDKLATAKETLTRTKSDMDKAKGNIASITKRIEAAAEQQQQQQQQQQQNGNGNGFGNGNNRNNNNNNNNNSDAQMAAATAAYAKADQEHHTADRAVTDLTRRLAKVKIAVGKAKEDLPVQIAKLKKADADLTTLTGKAPVDDLPADLDTIASLAGDGSGTAPAVGKDGKPTDADPPKPKGRFSDPKGGDTDDK